MHPVTLIPQHFFLVTKPPPRTPTNAGRQVRSPHWTTRREVVRILTRRFPHLRLGCSIDS